MVRCEREITPEQYNRAVKNNGMIADCDKHTVFSDSELYGYGVYLPKVRMDENGRCLCSFKRGESCD